MSVSNPDAYNFYFIRASSNNFFDISFSPYVFEGLTSDVATIAMPLPERLDLRTWYILPDGIFDPGLTSDVVIGLTRNEVVVVSETYEEATSENDDRILDVSALTFDKGDTIGIKINKTTALNPGSDRNNYNLVITGIFVRSN